MNIELERNLLKNYSIGMFDNDYTTDIFLDEELKLEPCTVFEILYENRIIDMYCYMRPFLIQNLQYS